MDIRFLEPKFGSVTSRQIALLQRIHRLPNPPIRERSALFLYLNAIHTPMVVRKALMQPAIGPANCEVVRLEEDDEEGDGGVEVEVECVPADSIVEVGNRPKNNNEDKVFIVNEVVGEVSVFGPADGLQPGVKPHPAHKGGDSNRGNRNDRKHPKLFTFDPRSG